MRDAHRKASVYENVGKQFNKAADLMGLDPYIRRILSKTTNEISVNFPVKMDNGEIKIGWHSWELDVEDSVMESWIKDAIYYYNLNNGD